MSMIKDIKQYLADNGIANAVYLGHMPNTGGVCLYQYAGQAPDLVAGLERPGLQVRATYTDYETAMSAVESIASVLNRLGNEISATGEPVPIDGTLYHRVQIVQSAFSVGKNENNQIEIVQNFYITRNLQEVNDG